MPVSHKLLTRKHLILSVLMFGICCCSFVCFVGFVAGFCLGVFAVAAAGFNTVCVPELSLPWLSVIKFSVRYLICCNKILLLVGLWGVCVQSGVSCRVECLHSSQPASQLRHPIQNNNCSALVVSEICLHAPPGFSPAGLAGVHRAHRTECPQ